VAGRIFGNAGTNGGTLAASASITGEIDNHFQKPVAPAPKPSWNAAVSNGRKKVKIKSGSVQAPAHYKFDQFTGRMTVSSNGDPDSYVEIWITGDLLGTIDIAQGVHATIYVEGNVVANANQLDNQSHLAANLQIFGVQPAVGVNKIFSVTLGQDLYASIYAPGHDVVFGGNGHVMGSVVGKSFTATGATYFHYDEALKVSAGKTLDYKVASWIEVLR
jgi:hypothetical protein